MTKIVLITGATSGLGAAIARKFAENGNHLILTGRREDRLDSITRELIETYHVEIFPLVFDVRNLKEVEDALELLPENWRKIDILINNAGLAVGLNPIHEGVIDDWERMIDTNVKGLLYMTRVFAPLMVARKKGHIINIVHCRKGVYPNGNVYCGSKFGRCNFQSHAHRSSDPSYQGEQIAPGAVHTEFSLVRFKGDEARAEAVYNGFGPDRIDVADVVYYVTPCPDM